MHRHIRFDRSQSTGEKNVIEIAVFITQLTTKRGANVRNVSLESPYGGQFTKSNQLIKQIA